MAKPRIFVSSTYYDLKHIRASLSLFIDSLGYESILFEKGQIAFISDDPLDISCYREAESADIFVLIIGGKYGSEVSSEKIIKKTQYTDYNSITRKEYETASNNYIPTYILIEKNVHAEYQTYKRNKSNTSIEYAHADNINIFKLIDDIYSKPNNNPIFSFEKYSEIEEWLREQWAGLFKDFLIRRGNIKRFDSLQKQVQNLESLNLTLKKYLEAILENKDTNERKDIIKDENEKLLDSKIVDKINNLNIVTTLFNHLIISNTQVKALLDNVRSANSAREFLIKIKEDKTLPIDPDLIDILLNFIKKKDIDFLDALNELREAIAENPWNFE